MRYLSLLKSPFLIFLALIEVLFGFRLLISRSWRVKLLHQFQREWRLLPIIRILWKHLLLLVWLLLFFRGTSFLLGSVSSEEALFLCLVLILVRYRTLKAPFHLNLLQLPLLSYRLLSCQLGLLFRLLVLQLFIIEEAVLEVLFNISYQVEDMQQHLIMRVYQTFSLQPIERFAFHQFKYSAHLVRLLQVEVVNHLKLSAKDLALLHLKQFHFLEVLG